MEGKLTAKDIVLTGEYKIDTLFVQDPIGKFIHEPTHTQINVYKKINKFQLFFIRLCFGLKYVER
jgi:hypothetical protein